MKQTKHGPETSYEERTHRHVQMVYARKTQQRQVFMDDLKKYRKQKDKQLMKIMVNSIGPKWYQALSVPQRQALDTLKFTIYQDSLEGRPTRTQSIIKALGIWPRPSTTDLMDCIILGQDDPKEMFANLFHRKYGHTIDGKRGSYDLNARLMLSSILYLGLENLIHLLRQRFRPDTSNEQKKPKRKPETPPPLASPYLQKMVAYLWDPPRWKPKPPPPLPNLDSLNEPYEEDPPLPKPPLPPPPPPPPKKKLPRSYCDKLAGVMPIEPHTSVEAVTLKTITQTTRRKYGSKMVTVEKKVYGIGSTMKKKGSARRRRPPAPSTGMWNSQYTINGVYTVQGKTVYVLGNVTILPACGELIHGGYRLLNGQNINIHCGIRGNPPPPKPDPCDCVRKWADQVLQYVKTTKCYCGHRYDYNNEGQFLPDELPFFEKPTRHTPYQFNYHTIYDIDPKRLHVDKEFKRLWDTDSVLRVDDGTQLDKKKPKKKKRSSTTCLGQNPAPQDYLKCALRLMRRINIAARLPDIHLVPELKEWMRRRIYGPYTPLQKAQMITSSNFFWQMFTRFATHRIPHVPVPKMEHFSGHTNWIHKQSLNDEFKKFVQRYKVDMYRLHANFTNLMWPSMYQAQFPDKKFREIYFSYLFGTLEDLTLMHPYSSQEVAERTTRIMKKRYICKPAGIELST